MFCRLWRNCSKEVASFFCLFFCVNVYLMFTEVLIIFLLLITGEKTSDDSVQKGTPFFLFHCIV